MKPGGSLFWVYLATLAACGSSAKFSSTRRAGLKVECPDKCNGHGVCSSGVCQCEPGWAGEACDAGTCPDNCNGHGVCSSGVCQCEPAWAGEACDAGTCPGNCNGHGVCSSGVCQCDAGWAGEACDAGTCPGNCSGHGICSSGVCQCDAGWVGEACDAAVLPDAGLEFYFGSSLPTGVPAGSTLDEGKSYGNEQASGIDYGWLCDGAPMVGYDFSGGRRAPPRSTYGLNHFDRRNMCKSGSTYLPVTWKLNLPDGEYLVEVIFPEAATPDCQVQSTKVCGRRGPCTFRKVLQVTGGLQVTGYGHDSRRCHSLSKVKVTKPPAVPAAGLEFYYGSSLPEGAASTSVLDEGQSFGWKTDSDFAYGWLCDGSPLNGYDFSGGRRAPPRGTYGLNHFDRRNQCKSGSTYLPVTWMLDIPDGRYSVEVIFPVSKTPDCQVQEVRVCGARGPCSYSKVLDITDGLRVTGYGHDSRKCHSIAKVKVIPA